MTMRHTKYVDILSKALVLCALLFAVLSFAVSVHAHNGPHDELSVDHEASERLPSELFDIRLSIDSREILIAQELTARAEFVSFGRVPTPVTLTWTVLDADDAEVYQASSETLVVETELTYPRRFVEIPSLEAGTYTLRLETRYRGDVEDVFTQSFTVIEPKDDILPFLILGFMTLIGTGWVVYLLRHHRGGITHERMVTITSRAAVFLVAGAVLPAAGLLVSESAHVATQQGTVIMSSLGLRTTSDASTFIVRMQEIAAAYTKLKGVIAYGDDTVVLASVQDIPEVSALHILDESKGVVVSMYRHLGFTPAKTVFSTVPSSEGLVQASDGTWSVVARFPRAEGGHYVVQSAASDVFAWLKERSRKDEDIFLVDAEGVIMTTTLHQKQGESLAVRFPDMWEKMRMNEYFEGICRADHPFTSRRIAVPTGEGYARYYLVMQGHYEHLSASIHFAF